MNHHFSAMLYVCLSWYSCVVLLLNFSNLIWVTGFCLQRSLFVNQTIPQTKVRLRQRIVGTILGWLVALYCLYLNPTLEMKLVLMVVTSTLFFFFRSNNYSFSTFFITLRVLISFDVMGFEHNRRSSLALIDTVLGSAIAWFAVSYHGRIGNISNSIK